MLVLVLSVCAYAGNMPNMGSGTPPPPSSSDGNIPNLKAGTSPPPPTSDGVIPNMSAGTSPVTEVALNLLQSVLALF